MMVCNRMHRTEGQKVEQLGPFRILDFLTGVGGARSVNYREEQKSLAIPLNAVFQVPIFYSG